MDGELTDAEAHQALDEVEAREGITDEDIIALLREAERLVRHFTHGGRRVLRSLYDGEPPPAPAPPPALRYDGPWTQDDYPIILHSERRTDSIDADPAFWGLGVSSPLLRHEQEWLDKILRPSRRWGVFRIKTKNPIISKGEIIGVTWKGTVEINYQETDWTMLHYATNNATVCYINGKGRRVLPVKIW